MKKRILSGLLVLVMGITLFPVSILAESPEAGYQFPSDSKVDIEDLSESDEEILSEEGKSKLYETDDLNDSSDIVIPEQGSQTQIKGNGEDLGDSDFQPSNADSILNSEEDINVGDKEENSHPADDVLPGEKDLPESSGEESEVTTDKGNNDDDLGDIQGSFSASPATTVLAPGESGSIDFTCNCNGTYYLHCAIGNSRTVGVQWGKWRDNNQISLFVTGKNVGATNIYVYLKSAATNATIAKLYVSVQVTNATITPSTTNISVTKGTAKKISFTVRGYRGNYYLQYGTTTQSAYSCVWGNYWNNGSMDMTITGRNAGSGRITVYLKAAGSNRTIASTSVNITVKANARIYLSTSRVSLTSGGKSTVTASYSNYSGNVYMQYGTTNSSAYKCTWGNWSGSAVPLTVTGRSQGSGTVVIYLKDASTNITLATASFSVNVSPNPSVTASKSNVIINSGSSDSVIFTVKNMEGNYYLQFGTNNTYAYSLKWGDWYNNGRNVALSISGRNSGSGRVTVYLKDGNNNTRARISINISVKAVKNPSVSLSRSVLTLQSGSSSAVKAIVNNINTSCYLQYGSTNTNAYSCRWTSDWSGNSIELTITGKAAGSGTVRVYLKRASDNHILDWTDIKVTVKNSGILPRLSYKFDNFGEAASLRVCQYMFNNRVANTIYNTRIGEGGNCFGMASTAGMFYAPVNGVNVSDFHSGKTINHDLDMGDRNNILGLTVKEFVQAMQTSQLSTRMRREFVSGSSLSSLVTAVRNSVRAGNPLIVNIYGYIGNRWAGHAILAYGVENYSSTQDRILIYDNNYPDMPRYLYLNKNYSGTYSGWSYKIFEGRDIIWSNTTSGRIGYTDYAVYYNLWRNRGNLTNDNTNMLVANSDNLTIKDVDDNVVAKVEDGQLIQKYKGIEQVYYDSLMPNGKVNENVILRLPVDLYTIKNENNNNKKFVVEMVNEELSARVESGVDKVTLCADDSSNLASVLMDTEKDGKYQITLGSSRPGEPEEQSWSGTGNGDTVSVMVEDGQLETCNTENVSLTIGNKNPQNKKTSYVIKASTTGGGSISPEGNNTVLRGDEALYTIKANKGYRIKKVVVDGKNVGEVSTYVFRDVEADHTITAEFSKIPTASEKPSNTKNPSNKTKQILKSTVIKKCSSKSGKIKLQWKKCKGATGYEIQYSVFSSFKKSKKIIVKSEKTVQKTITKLKKKKLYYVRIRAYKKISGRKIYSDWSKSKKVKVKK